MIKLVTEEPDILESEYKRCFKYPYMACETLCSNNEKLIDGFLGTDKKKNFRELFKVFRKNEYDDETNSTLTGYISKIVEAMISNFPQKVKNAKFLIF